MQLKPGLRFAVEPHGVHFWSSQGQVQRPMDPISLRIDNQERMVNMLNDREISPTNYMLAFLRQRACKLPEKTVTIPNITPEVDPAIEAVSPPRPLSPPRDPPWLCEEVSLKEGEFLVGIRYSGRRSEGGGGPGCRLISDCSKSMPHM